MTRHLARRVLLAALLCGASVLHAQGWPAKPIHLVVPFTPGGSSDILGRAIAQKLQEAWGQPVVIDNVPGAGGNIGADKVAKSPADGHTLVMGTVGTHAINGAIYSKMPYDMVRDFAPVGHVASAPNLLVVTNDLPVKSVSELIAYMKANTLSSDLDVARERGDDGLIHWRPA